MGTAGGRWAESGQVEALRRLGENRLIIFFSFKDPFESFVCPLESCKYLITNHEIKLLKIKKNEFSF